MRTFVGWLFLGPFYPMLRDLFKPQRVVVVVRRVD